MEAPDRRSEASESKMGPPRNDWGTSDLIAFDTESPYIDTIAGAAVEVWYKVAYRGTNERDIGSFAPEQKIAAGG